MNAARANSIGVVDELIAGATVPAGGAALPASFWPITAKLNERLNNSAGAKMIFRLVMDESLRVARRKHSAPPSETQAGPERNSSVTRAGTTQTTTATAKWIETERLAKERRRQIALERPEVDMIEKV